MSWCTAGLSRVPGIMVLGLIASHGCGRPDLSTAATPPMTMATSIPASDPIYLLGRVVAPDTRQTLWTLNDSLVSAVTQDAALLVTIDRSHRLEARQLRDGRISWTREWPGTPSLIQLTPSGVVVVDGSRVSLLARKDGSELHRIDLATVPRRITIGDGPRPVIALTSGTSIEFIDLDTGSKAVVALAAQPARDIDVNDLRRRFGPNPPTDAFHMVDREPSVTALENKFVIAEGATSGDHAATHVVVVDHDGSIQLDTWLVGPGRNPPSLAMATPSTLGFVTSRSEAWSQHVQLQPNVKVEPPLDFYVDNFLGGNERRLLRIDGGSLIAMTGPRVSFRIPNAFPTWDDNHELAAVEVGDVVVVCVFATAAPETLLLGLDAKNGSIRYRLALPTSAAWARRPFEWRNVTVERAANSVVVTREELDGIIVEAFDAKTGARWLHDEHAWTR